jgi:hypothetical protein|tara:strand:- start:1317 stop:1787 length:471 start_codon:yes stop_codon:yes gene_type:complete
MKYGTEGDYYYFKDKRELEKKLPFIIKRLEKWDYNDHPAAVRIERYVNPASRSQENLFHAWVRILAEKWCAAEKKKATKDEFEFTKIFLKNKFLGVANYSFRDTSFKGQVKSITKLSKGEMCFFMDQIYNLASEKNIHLPIPDDSEYLALKSKQDE